METHKYSLSKYRLRFSFLFACTFACSFNLKAQIAPVKQWDKTFGGSGYEFLKSVKQTSDGGYILAGDSESGAGFDKTQPLIGSTDFWVVKLDASGNKTWDKTFGGNYIEFLNYVIQTTDGGYLLGGYTNTGISGDKTQPNQGGKDYWILKIDANGNKLWDKAFGGSDYDELWLMQQTANGGYILGGSSKSGISGDKTQVNNGGYDYWLIQIDGSGNKLWDKTFGGNGDEFFSSVMQTPDGGFMLAGSSISGINGDKTQASNGNFDYWLLKIDANGNKVWDKSFGGSGDDKQTYLSKTSDGNYVVSGYSTSGISGNKTQASLGNYDYWLLKIDGNGNMIWDKSFGGNNEDKAYSILQTTDGGFILGGTSDSNISGNKSEASKGGGDYWIVKLNGSGIKLWDKTLGGNNFDDLYALEQTSDGGYFIGGTSGSTLSGDKSDNLRGLKDYWVVKLSAGITGINETEAGFAISLFPNPSQRKFNLELNNVTVPTAQVIISDVLGREIMKQEIPVIGNNISQELDLKAAKGIYLLQLKIGKQIFNRKIIVD